MKPESLSLTLALKGQTKGLQEVQMRTAGQFPQPCIGKCADLSQLRKSCSKGRFDLGSLPDPLRQLAENGRAGVPVVQQQDACEVLLMANGSSCTECATSIKVVHLAVCSQASTLLFASAVISTASLFLPCYFSAVTFCIPQPVRGTTNYLLTGLRPSCTGFQSALC